MHIYITRYYGDQKSTKSRMKVLDHHTGKVLLKCEAREPAFCDYSTLFKGCSQYCLPVGQYAAKIKSTDISPMTIVILNASGHKACRIGWSALHQSKSNEILIGIPDDYPKPKWRQIYFQEETFRKLEKLCYDAFYKREDITVTVTNDIEIP